ncbi:hypothetical protein FRB90_006019, partial [Tulasnella sp. 427]
MTTHLAPPQPIPLRQRKSFTVLTEENGRRTRAVSGAATPQPRIVSDLFFRFESPGAGSSKRQPSVSPAQKRTAVDPEQRPLKASSRLQDKIAEMEIRARTAIIEKNNLHSELTALQNECRRSAEREAALRVALERAEACIKGDSPDEGQSSLVLKRKLEDMERRHTEATHKHVVELEAMRRKLEQTQETLRDQEELIQLQQQHEAEKDTTIISLEAKLAKQEEELESLKLQLREAEIRQLAGRNAVDTLTHERRRHESTKAKLKALQATVGPDHTRRTEDLTAARNKLSSVEENFSILEHKYTELKSAARALADEFEVQSSQLGATSRLVVDLTTAYGRLASQNRVERRVFDDMKMEKDRLEILLGRVATELADREGRVIDLEETVEEGKDAKRILEAALLDSEEEITMLRASLAESSSQDTTGWELYQLLKQYLDAFGQLENGEALRERARAEGDIGNLRAINDTLQRTLQKGDDLQKKLLNMHAQLATRRSKEEERPQRK